MGENSAIKIVLYKCFSRLVTLKKAEVFYLFFLSICRPAPFEKLYFLPAKRLKIPLFLWILELTYKMARTKR